MNKQIALKKRIQEILSENIIYLNYIGIFKENKEEMFSVTDSHYDSNFDLNFVYAFGSISAIKNKSTEKEDMLGNMKSFFINYKGSSYYCAKIDKNYFLVVFKKDFTNYAFMIYLINLIKDELMQANN